MKDFEMIILKQNRYDKVKDGTMTVWLTLNDDWAKAVQIGEILRVMCDETSECVYVRCTGFMIYDTFEQLYNKADKNTLGYNGTDKENIALIKKQMFHQCSPEKEKQHGVRGIIFEYLPDLVPLDQMTDKELETFFNQLINGVIKVQKKLMKSTKSNNEIMDMLTKYIDDNTELFFNCSEQKGAIDVGMFKWVLAENMKRTRKLIELIEFHEMERMHID